MNGPKGSPPVRQPSLAFPIFLAVVALIYMTGSAIALTGLLIGHAL